MLKFKIILIFIVVFINASCVKDLDFNQVDELEAQMPIKVSMLYLKLTQDSFIDNTGAVSSLLQDETEIHVEDLVSQSVTESVVIDTYFSNTFNSGFFLEFEFYNDAGVFLFSIDDFTVPANASNFHHEIPIAGDDFSDFTNTTKVKVRINVLDTSAVDVTIDDQFKMKSSINFQIKIKN